MKDYPWMIYGASGRSGKLIARRAVAQGLQPILAGRNAKVVQKIAEELNLSWRAFGIDDLDEFGREISGVNLLVNAAGPLKQSSVLVAESCLGANTHYFDLSNQVPSLVAIYTLDAEAKEKDLTLLPGLAFSPAASNCLVKHLHTLLPDADSLDIALRPTMQTFAAGANLTVAENIAEGGFRRRSGALERYWFGGGVTEATLPTGIRRLLPAALGDVEASYRCTNIPNIATYLITDIPILPGFLNKANESPRQASEMDRTTSNGDNGLSNNYWDDQQSLVWARMSKIGQKSLEGWLQFGESLNFTATLVVAGVAQLIKKKRLSTGALSPAMALGANFILDLPNVKRTVRRIK